jgi:hypothetical protein
LIARYKIAGTVDFTAVAEGPLKPEADRTLAESISHEVLLYPRGLVFQPKNWPEPLRDVGGGVIRIVEQEAEIENMSALYGQDRWLLDTARVPLVGLKDRVQVNDIAGTAEFHPPSPEYPKALRATVRALSPSGEFPVAGRMDINPHGEPGKRATYDFDVTTDGGAFAVTPKRIPITNIRGDARVLRETIEIGTVAINHFDGDTLGGTISAKATFITTKPRSYAGTASVRDVKLEALAPYFDGASEKAKEKLAGRAFANVELSGATEKETALDTLRGRGRLEVFDGDFFELPVLGSVSKTVNGDKRKDAGTVGEAAVLFSVKDRTIHIRDAAMSAPLLGVQGDGAISLDGELDLTLVAAPLADWRDKMKQTNIPILSDVTGEIVGAIQRMLNTATRGLLYQFHVVGDVKKPQVNVVPAPVLNEAKVLIFGNMLGKSKDKRLIDTLKDEEK